MVCLHGQDQRPQTLQSVAAVGVLSNRWPTIADVGSRRMQLPVRRCHVAKGLASIDVLRGDVNVQRVSVVAGLVSSHDVVDGLDVLLDRFEFHLLSLVAPSNVDRHQVVPIGHPVRTEGPPQLLASLVHHEWRYVTEEPLHGRRSKLGDLKVVPFQELVTGLDRFIHGGVGHQGRIVDGGGHGQGRTGTAGVQFVIVAKIAGKR
mmetsp:Transcript_3612/g.4186  ORF Transcript_3612/g.4186 Transcript_3612/m.4186 type:complete len:204 (+) Transcript_3612:255-866(+)